MAKLDLATPVEIIVAMDKANGIGKAGELPWYLPGDMKYFKMTTSTVMHAGQRNMVIMGRKTWDSIPVKYRPLPDRLNVVVSRTLPRAVDVDPHVFDSVDEAIDFGHSMPIEKIFVIGGAEIYKLALPYADILHITRIEGTYDCDVFFPEIDTDKFVEIWRGEANKERYPVDAPTYTFTLMRKINKPVINHELRY